MQFQNNLKKGVEGAEYQTNGRRQGALEVPLGKAGILKRGRSFVARTPLAKSANV